MLRVNQAASRDYLRNAVREGRRKSVWRLDNFYAGSIEHRRLCYFAAWAVEIKWYHSFKESCHITWNLNSICYHHDVRDQGPHFCNLHVIILKTGSLPPRVLVLHLSNHISTPSARCQYFYISWEELLTADLTGLLGRALAPNLGEPYPKMSSPWSTRASWN